MDVYLHTVGNNLPTASAKRNQAADSAAKPLRTGPAGADDTADSSLRMNAIKAALAAAPIVSEEKVALVGNAIQAGHYEINPQRVAEKIIELEQLLP